MWESLGGMIVRMQSIVKSYVSIVLIAIARFSVTNLENMVGYCIFGDNRVTL